MVYKHLHRPTRHGWGKMSWANGTLYGSDSQFIYGEGDRYIGHWSNDKQDGTYNESTD